MKWLPIATCPNSKLDGMFVVIAIDIKPVSGASFTYTSDPYCVWYDDGYFVRWPHLYHPTHWCELPSIEKGVS
jgi:hypothetical protein